MFSVVLHGVRGVYYSTMSETGIPVSMTATATAVVAVLGYTPDMFMSLWCGHILDAYGYEAGFKKNICNYSYFLESLHGASVL